MNPENFWARVDKSPAHGGCWIWTGAGQKYGNVWLTRKTATTAQRFAYTLAHGEIPKGLQIDHRCRVPRCVNPDHLEAVTPQENRRRATEAKTHCHMGHPFAGENLFVTPAGVRVCVTCRRERARRRWAEKYGEPTGIHWCALRTHCKYGHAYDDENVYTCFDGSRGCRTCRRRRVREYKKRRRTQREVAA